MYVVSNTSKSESKYCGGASKWSLFVNEIVADNKEIDGYSRKKIMQNSMNL